MAEVIDALILDLLEWIGPTSRPYPEVMEAWRTSCPQLPVWEKANARGYLQRSRTDGHKPAVSLTQLGRDPLHNLRPQPTL